MKNKFIVIEGIDGAGKSTIVKMLSGVYQDKCGVFVEPTTNSPYTGAIRAILSGKKENSESQLLELFKLDRLWNIQNNIVPSLEKNKITILDRYYFSTAAYQGQTLGQVRSILDDYITNHDILQPDYVFYLKLDSDTALSRISSRKGSLDIFEKKVRLEKIMDNYNYLFMRYSFPFSVSIVDAKKDSRNILNYIINKVFPVE